MSEQKNDTKNEAIDINATQVDNDIVPVNMPLIGPKTAKRVAIARTDSRGRTSYQYSYQCSH
jgi:DNA uptake protein ComE-like DNA-binding protein